MQKKCHEKKTDKNNRTQKANWFLPLEKLYSTLEGIKTKLVTL